MAKLTIRSISRAWKNIFSKDSESKRLMIITKINKNNSELFELVYNQIALLKEYEEEFKGFFAMEDYMKEYQEMLDLTGKTADILSNEWDNETGRKS